MTVDELQVLITANTRALQKEIAKANTSIDTLKKHADKAQNGVTSMFKKLKHGVVALGIGKAIKESITSGMNAVESDSLFETSLGKWSNSVRKWSDEVSNALGLNAVNMRKNTGVIYNMTTSMGVAEKNALKMSKGVSLLSEDMASFYNLDSTEAFNKLRAGLTGETEPLKALGILVDENTIKQVAYSSGIATTGAELTQQQKVLARYVAILKQTGNAQGDLARTIDSPANQLRLLKNQVNQLGLAFSNFLIPALRTILPYITAFVKVITSALLSLSKLLGFKKAESDTSNVISNMNGLGTSIDNTNKKAKKLQNTMSSLDELHTIQTETDSGSNGGGASAGNLDFDLSDYDAHLELISSKTDEIVEKIKNAFSKIGEGINFNNLVTSFDNLKQAIEPITEKLFSGLKWAYDNLLVPLSQWTIGELLPAFLNGISGALTLLNPLLESFMNLGGWLWDSFLQPIASWTGGLIVDTLNGLGDALTKIGEWASNNQGIIDKMVTSFAIFFGLWELTKIMAFISMSGGLIAAISGITAGLWSSVAAKIADKAETVALTFLYAKDFVMSIVSGTGAIIKQIGQWVILTGAKVADAIQTGVATTAQFLWNTAATIGATVTKALGVAFTFLTSPIGLVIVAITAAVAAGVLLYKNWDKIMSFASKLGKKIKEVFGSIGSFISDVFSNIAGVFKGVINGIVSGLNVFIKGINKIGFDVPDWVPVIGGKRWGFNIPQIPKLAKGGVLKEETVVRVAEYSNARSNPEIISPRDMMKDTVKEAMAELGLNNSGTQKVEVDITGELRASGNDLVLVYDKTKNDKGYDGINNPSFAY